MTIIGLVAGVLTTVCWVPQVVRAWRTRSTRDFSWLYLIVLSVGIALWAVYGILRADVAVIVANVVALCFLLFLLAIKLMEIRNSTGLPSPGHAPSYRGGRGSGR